MSGFREYVAQKRTFEFLESISELDKQEALDLVESMDPETVALIEHHAGIDLRETIINEGIIDTVKSGINKVGNFMQRVGGGVKRLADAGKKMYDYATPSSDPNPKFKRPDPIKVSPELGKLYDKSKELLNKRKHQIGIFRTPEERDTDKQIKDLETQQHGKPLNRLAPKIY